MRTIDEIRKDIDMVDDKIVAALRERFALTDEMRDLKATLAAQAQLGEGAADRRGAAVGRGAVVPSVDPKREREIIERAIAATPAAHRDTVAAIYERIFGGSRGFIETIARGVAISDGKVLLCRAKGSKTSYLPGGHIEFGESAKTALVREIREELGVTSLAGDFLGVIENSFLQHGRPHSEINLVYELEVSLDPREAPQALEPWIEFEWRDLDDIASAGLLPAEMKRFL